MFYLSSLARSASLFFKLFFSLLISSSVPFFSADHFYGDSQVILISKTQGFTSFSLSYISAKNFTSSLVNIENFHSTAEMMAAGIGLVGKIILLVSIIPFSNLFGLLVWCIWIYLMMMMMMTMKIILLVDINGDGALILLSNLALIKIVHNPNVPGGRQHTQSVRFLAEIMTKHNRLDNVCRSDFNKFLANAL